MDVRNAYNSIPHDLSGAANKNRFRLEMLWGISKMFDLYDKPDFCVVFDYKCDVEIHFNDCLKFYQIKTHKIQSPYKFTVNSKSDKNTGKSIIGRSYLLMDISNCINIANNELTPIKNVSFGLQRYRKSASQDVFEGVPN